MTRWSVNIAAIKGGSEDDPVRQHRNLRLMGDAHAGKTGRSSLFHSVYGQYGGWFSGFFSRSRQRSGVEKFTSENMSVSLAPS